MSGSHVITEAGIGFVFFCLFLVFFFDGCAKFLTVIPEYINQMPVLILVSGDR